MSNRLHEVVQEINDLKRQLTELWETKQQTDAEVLAFSTHIDRLLNDHDRLLSELSGYNDTVL